MDAQFGADYGRALGYKKSPPVSVQKANVVSAIDLQKFWDGYVNLVNLPTPIKGS